MLKRDQIILRPLIMFVMLQAHTQIRGSSYPSGPRLITFWVTKTLLGQHTVLVTVTLSEGIVAMERRTRSVKALKDSKSWISWHTLSLLCISLKEKPLSTHRNENVSLKILCSSVYKKRLNIKHIFQLNSSKCFSLPNYPGMWVSS